MEITKAEVSQMKKFAKSLGVPEVPKDPSELRVSLMTFIDEMPEDECTPEIKQWFNMQVDLEEEVERVEERVTKLKETKENANKGKAKAATKKAAVKKEGGEPKSQFNHRLSTQAGKMDEALKRGATIEEIAEEAGCNSGRVHGHKKHLEEAHGCKFEVTKTGKVKLVKAA